VQSQAEQPTYWEAKRVELKLVEEQFRREQRKSFETYCCNPELFPDEPPARHHAFMIDGLQRVL
jgi:hypothetical protein